MKKRPFLAIFIAMVSMAFFLGGCGDGGGGSTGDSNTRQWTYLVYLGADSDLSAEGLEDIDEMAQVGSSDKVAIVVQAEFDSSYTGSPDTFRGLVEKGTRQTYFDGATNIGEVDMGSPEALTDFITWGTTTYPAEHYALVIWDHGDGWKERGSTTKTSLLRGAVQDTSAGTFMSLPDLANGVANAGVPLDIINFDACLMAMYEVAYEFSGLTDYMVFSEENEPGNGDPYDTILGDLAAKPKMTAAELAAVIVNRYDESYAAYFTRTTKSAVDMSRLNAVDTAVMALGQALMADADANDVAMDARTASKHFYTAANHDLHDLASYIFNNAPDGDAKDAAGALISAVQAMVISNGTNPDSDASTSVGLAIYMPTTAQTSPWELGEYAALACNATSRPAGNGTWGAYVEWLIDREGGGTSGVTGGGYTITVRWTTPDGADCDADLNLTVYEPDDWYFEWPHSALFIPNSANGTFSEDSDISGVSMEYYRANREVESGTYDFAIQYYLNGDTCSQAQANVYFNDGSMEGDGLLVASGIMDLSNSYWDDYDDIPGCNALNDSMGDYLKCMSYYSDVLFVGELVAGQTDASVISQSTPARSADGMFFKKDPFAAKPAKPTATQ